MLKPLECEACSILSDLFVFSVPRVLIREPKLQLYSNLSQKQKEEKSIQTQTQTQASKSDFNLKKKTLLQVKLYKRKTTLCVLHEEIQILC
jgi:hypothetical protein